MPKTLVPETRMHQATVRATPTRSPGSGQEPRRMASLSSNYNHVRDTPGPLVREKGLAEVADGCDRLEAAGVPIQPVVVGEGAERLWLGKRLPVARLTGRRMGKAMAPGLPTAGINTPSGSPLPKEGTRLRSPRGDLDVLGCGDNHTSAAFPPAPSSRRAV